jgi:uncharacterized protein
MNEPTADAPTAPEAAFPQLNAIEARVLGSLVEKESTTPEQYPMTENSLVLACNQKTSRDPVMNLSPGDVGHALRQMEQRKLVRSQHGSRAQRYEHRMAEAYSLTRQQQAVLAVLLLRGPQTANEILTRSERMAKFADAEELRHSLERLAQRDAPLLVRIPKGPGQREDRYMHLLCGAVDVAAIAAMRGGDDPSGTEAGGALAQRIDALEARVAALEEVIRQLGG